MGVAIYALLRHRGLPWWGASLPALPVLFDSYELHLEHQVAADTLFIFLATIALVILCWSDRPSVPVMAVAGSADRVRDRGEIGGRAAARHGPGRHAGQASGLAAPDHPARSGHHPDRRVHDLVTIAGRTVRADRIVGHVPVQPGQHLRRMREDDPPGRPAATSATRHRRTAPAAGEYIWADNELAPHQNTYTPLYKPQSATPRCGSRHRQRPGPAVRGARHRRPAGGLPARGDA